MLITKLHYYASPRQRPAVIICTDIQMMIYCQPRLASSHRRAGQELRYISHVWVAFHMMHLKTEEGQHIRELGFNHESRISESEMQGCVWTGAISPCNVSTPWAETAAAAGHWPWSPDQDISTVDIQILMLKMCLFSCFYIF